MTESNNPSYYSRRAEACLANAQRASDPYIAGIHLDLHARYLEMLERSCRGHAPGRAENAAAGGLAGPARRA